MAETPNPATTSFPAPTISLPLGVEILRTYSGALICLEIGWVMFVSVTMFICSSVYLTLFLLGLADKINTDWNFMDMFYHFIALLFYFGAFLLEATVSSAGTYVNSTTCIRRPRGNIMTFLDYREYSINVAAAIFAFIVTLCYGCSMFMGFRRWRK
ncbi:protein MAL2 isoform X2 [Rhinichthys klamathensis goyatoka]|uniref:protein MAL2 isoform X2 n=1 Tax=Rhinichthys klamathensis goyatoka TaxID=3034132 RepID=UPI0024B5F531|nr:protein MAL2 isoform X2 [Rhinichthys klamathensis goyatoka]